MSYWIKCFLLLFTGADFWHWSICLNTISQLLEAHLSRGIDKNTSTKLTDNLVGCPDLYVKIDYLAKQLRRKPFHGISREQKMQFHSLATIRTLPKDISYELTNPGKINQHFISTLTNNTWQCDGVDLSTVWKFMTKKASASSGAYLKDERWILNRPSWRTTKIRIQGEDWTKIVIDEGIQNPWNICSLSVVTIPPGEE